MDSNKLSKLYVVINEKAEVEDVKKPGMPLWKKVAYLASFTIVLSTAAFLLVTSARFSVPLANSGNSTPSSDSPSLVALDVHYPGNSTVMAFDQKAAVILSSTQHSATVTSQATKAKRAYLTSAEDSETVTITGTTAQSLGYYGKMTTATDGYESSTTLTSSTSSQTPTISETPTLPSTSASAEISTQSSGTSSETDTVTITTASTTTYVATAVTTTTTITVPTVCLVGPWETCGEKDTCVEGYTCCEGQVDLGKGKKTTCRLKSDLTDNGCATSAKVKPWKSCSSYDTCADGYTCCIGHKDLHHKKSTCRLSSNLTNYGCAEKAPIIVAAWENCVSTDTCAGGFKCCVSPKDSLIGKKNTCRMISPDVRENGCQVHYY